MRRHILPASVLAVGVLSLLAAAPSTQPTATKLRLVYHAIPTSLPSGATTRASVSVDAIPDAVRRDYRLDRFYQKCLSVDGILIIGSSQVSDYAFVECAYTLDHLLQGRTMALDALVRNRVRVGIMAVTEYTMDIPEDRWMGDGAFNDRRSRGLGGLPLATCAEENLLNLRGDPYGGGRVNGGENITIHEFSHTVASAIQRVNPAWYRRLRDAYNQALARGIYGNSYAATDEQEYWAEGAQCWFDCANPANAGGARNRAELKTKDASLAALLTEVYGDGPWRYRKTTDPNRPAEDRTHLAGLDRNQMPVFDFNHSPRIMAAATQPAPGGRGAGGGGGTGAGRGAGGAARGGN